jgi:hypothetical protein
MCLYMCINIFYWEIIVTNFFIVKKILDWGLQLILAFSYLDCHTFKNNHFKVFTNFTWFDHYLTTYNDYIHTSILYHVNCAFISTLCLHSRNPYLILCIYYLTHLESLRFLIPCFPYPITYSYGTDNFLFQWVLHSYTWIFFKCLLLRVLVWFLCL